MTATRHISRDDIKAKLHEIQADATETVESAKTQLVAVGVAVCAVVLVAVFVLGRRSGRRRTTIVEIKRN